MSSNPVHIGQGNTSIAKPLDIIERIADENDWISDRRNDNEMAIQVPGSWCDYSMFFAWNDVANAIHFTCALDMRIHQTNKLVGISDLFLLINEELWLGNFGLWKDEGLPMFRHAMPLCGTSGPSIEQMEEVIETAIFECERFYPAFQLFIWGGKTPKEAIAAAITKTIGEC